MTKTTMRSAAALPLITILLLALHSVASPNVAAAGENPFTPKGYAMRYWTKQISNDLPPPKFLFNKASPLSAAQYAAFSKLADQSSLSSHLPEFCSKANLLCFLDSAHRDTANNKNYATEDRVRRDGFKYYGRGNNNNKNYTAEDRVW